MKTFFTLLFTLIFLNTNAQKLLVLPFFDDFSNDYENWTHYSIVGDDQWHLSGDDGIDGSKCARFYITTNPPQANDDWLVSKVFDTESASNIAIEFKFWYHGNGMKPVFYYTTSFTGDVSTTDWTELDNSFWKNEWNWNSVRIEIENPGDTFVFAIRYQSTTENSQYILIDNFSIESFEPLVLDKVGESEHFEFYTNITGESDFWLDINNALEENYARFWESWMAPGWEPYLDEDTKIKICYTEKKNVPTITDETPEIQSGFFDGQSYSIYLTPLNSEEKTDYYTNMEGLAVHAFAGFAKQKQLMRDGFPYDDLPTYFYESFGLFIRGYRTRHDSIMSNIAKHPGNYTIEDLDSMDIFKNTSDRDIILSYTESQLIGGGSYWNEPPNAGWEKAWNTHLTYFHDTTDVVRIKKYAESENFDIFCSSRDTMCIDSFKVWLERTRKFWIDSFDVQINNRYSLIILYDEKTGMDITGFNHWNGGAGGLNISPHNFYHPVAGDGLQGYPWLLAHEFSHCFSYRFGGSVPNGFYQEGLANFVAYKIYGTDWMQNKWQINEVFDSYQQRYSRYPTMDEFGFNPNNDIYPYFFGLQFLRYVETFCSLIQIKNYFSGYLDFSALNKSKSEVGMGYINYLKQLAGIETNAKTIDEFSDNHLQYFFNPGDNASIITFQIQTSGKVNLSIYDIQGIKICTLIDEKLNAGTHTFQLGNQIQISGIYLCKLATSEGVSTLKFIINNQ